MSHEFYLSRLMRAPVLGRSGRTGVLLDLCIPDLEADYPAVDRVFYRDHEQKLRAVAWAQVRKAGYRGLELECLEEGELLEALPSEVLLKRDVLDALVLDLEHRRATRANDLVLTCDEGLLRLTAADVSSKAIVRRLTRGRLDLRPHPYDWRYLEFLRGDPAAAAQGAGYRRRIVHLPPGDLAHFVTLIPYLHGAELLTLVPPELGAATLQLVPLRRQVQVFEELHEKVAAALAARMCPDLAADLLAELHPQETEKYLNLLPASQREAVTDLLQYEPDTVGGAMTNAVVRLEPGDTVREVRRRLRQSEGLVEMLFVTEPRGGRLQGYLTLSSLLQAEDDQSAHDLVNRYVPTLGCNDPARKASYEVLRSNLPAFPVIGSQGELLGAMTVEAALRYVLPSTYQELLPRGVFA